ncbi:MAG: undecaprenyldiphospho-muramoylpentapeptide beta-N-acetylglucosaminyltransferase [bacterium]|nr:undecaprenyldiphospho-muramoylpentapeptide beta-N-acetylglucosaminyltransferase [bacterium]
MSKKILIAAGGTGGHIYPAIVLGHELQSEFNMDILFAGTKKGIGKDIFTKEKFNFELFDVEGLSRKLNLSLFISFWKYFKNFVKALFLLRRFKPDVVVGMGGYITPPIVLAAVLCNIPTVIHEQNVIPGLANRFLNKLVDQTTVAFPEALHYFKNAVVTGNPVRLGIELAKKETGIHGLNLDPGKITLFIFGGSQGSHNLNEVFKDTLLLLEKKGIDLQFIIMTGENDWEKMDEFCRNLRFKSIVRPFFYNIEDAYGASDLIIARSGALSISEICACGRPAIFIPYPYAAGNHQYFNAKRVETKGGGIIITEKELSPEKLAKAVFDLLENKARLIMMGERNRGLYQKGAAKILALNVLSLIK